jgi:hypothetical protein
MHRISLTLVTLSLALPVAFAQQSSSSLVAPELLAGGAPIAAALGASSSGSTMPASASRPGGFPGIGVGVKVGILGVGVEAAVPVGRHLNVRGGANLQFRSGEASVDWFPWAKGFHISPGALIYNGNQVTGGANVPGGKTFTLNGTTYTSSATSPVTGSGSLTFTKAAPKLTVGWGNLVPRSERHFSFPFEVGFAYVGDPKFVLNLAGTACYNYQGTLYCDNVATDPNIQANLAAEQKKISNDVATYARFFPILSQGFAVRF